MRVLLVEDDEVISRVVALTLRSNGAAVDLTHAGEEALDLAKHYDYDIIVLDSILPDMIGFDVIRKLRAYRISVPIIAISSQDSVAKKYHYYLLAPMII